MMLPIFGSFFILSNGVVDEHDLYEQRHAVV